MLASGHFDRGLFSFYLPASCPRFRVAAAGANTSKKPSRGAFNPATMMSSQDQSQREAPSHENAGFMETTFAQHQPALVRYATRLLGDSERARDVVQDTFVRLMAQPPPCFPAAAGRTGSSPSD